MAAFWNAHFKHFFTLLVIVWFGYDTACLPAWDLFRETKIGRHSILSMLACAPHLQQDRGQWEKNCSVPSCDSQWGYSLCFIPTLLSMELFSLSHNQDRSALIPGMSGIWLENTISALPPHWPSIFTETHLNLLSQTVDSTVTHIKLNRRSKKRERVAWVSVLALPKKQIHFSILTHTYACDMSHRIWNIYMLQSLFTLFEDSV